VKHAAQGAIASRDLLDLERLYGDNTTSGIIGFGSNSVPVTLLADTGSDTTFISQRIVILGMNWLKAHHGHWDLAGSKLTLANGAGHRVAVEKKDMKSQSGLPTICDPRYEPVVQRFRYLFREELPEKLSEEREIKHEIDTGDARYYHLSLDHCVEQEAQIKSLLEKGLIRPSSSAWGFPVLFVPKPDGKWRMCIDYRMLNKVTRKDTYPFPRIQDCLDDIGQAKRLSKIDLTSGYWQIHVPELSIPKTAFNTRAGKYEFIAMPFGLCNAPATVQRIMNNALRDFLGKFVIVYLDDIVVYSDSDEEHEKHLTQVFEALQKHELFAKPSKCTIVQFLRRCKPY
jgi:Reverse transcriptase (RNA-dependent DNA polymerase)